MLILGIVLAVVGLIVFRWNANALNMPSFARPMIFHSVIAVFVINILWIGLFAGALYSFWQVNPMIVFILVGIYAILWIVGFILGSDKAKAKKIFKIYRQVKLFRPKASKEEIFKETARLYFQSLRWDEDKIRITVESMFDKKIGATDEKDIQSVASSILIFENPSDDFGSRFDFNGFTKRWEKKRKAIDAAYQVVLGKSEVITVRPVLTKNTSEWVRSVGLNPDEMSNEQLAVFAEIDDSKRSNWAVRFLYGVSAVFFLLAGFNLITLEISGFLWNGVISFIAWYIGHKIQMRRISKKFYEASIIKYAQEQASKA